MRSLPRPLQTRPKHPQYLARSEGLGAACVCSPRRSIGSASASSSPTSAPSSAASSASAAAAAVPVATAAPPPSAGLPRLPSRLRPPNALISAWTDSTPRLETVQKCYMAFATYGEGHVRDQEQEHGQQEQGEEEGEQEEQEQEDAHEKADDATYKQNQEGAWVEARDRQTTVRNKTRSMQLSYDWVVMPMPAMPPSLDLENPPSASPSATSTASSCASSPPAAPSSAPSSSSSSSLVSSPSPSLAPSLSRSHDHQAKSAMRLRGGADFLDLTTTSGSDEGAGGSDSWTRAKGKGKANETVETEGQGLSEAEQGGVLNTSSPSADTDNSFLELDEGILDDCKQRVTDAKLASASPPVVSVPSASAIPDLAQRVHGSKAPRAVFSTFLRTVGSIIRAATRAATGLARSKKRLGPTERLPSLRRVLEARPISRPPPRRRSSSSCDVDVVSEDDEEEEQDDTLSTTATSTDCPEGDDVRASVAQIRLIRSLEGAVQRQEPPQWSVRSSRNSDCSANGTRLAPETGLLGLEGVVTKSGHLLHYRRSFFGLCAIDLGGSSDLATILVRLTGATSKRRTRVNLVTSIPNGGRTRARDGHLSNDATRTAWFATSGSRVVFVSLRARSHGPHRLGRFRCSIYFDKTTVSETELRAALQSSHVLAIGWQRRERGGRKAKATASSWFRRIRSLPARFVAGIATCLHLSTAAQLAGNARSELSRARRDLAIPLAGVGLNGFSKSNIYWATVAPLAWSLLDVPMGVAVEGVHEERASGSVRAALVLARTWDDAVSTIHGILQREGVEMSKAELAGQEINVPVGSASSARKLVHCTLGAQLADLLAVKAARDCTEDRLASDEQPTYGYALMRPGAIPEVGIGSVPRCTMSDALAHLASAHDFAIVRFAGTVDSASRYILAKSSKMASGIRRPKAEPGIRGGIARTAEAEREVEDADDEGDGRRRQTFGSKLLAMNTCDGHKVALQFSGYNFHFNLPTSRCLPDLDCKPLITFLKSGKKGIQLTKAAAKDPTCCKSIRLFFRLGHLAWRLTPITAEEHADDTRWRHAVQIFDEHSFGPEVLRNVRAFELGVETLAQEGVLSWLSPRLTESQLAAQTSAFLGEDTQRRRRMERYAELCRTKDLLAEGLPVLWDLMSEKKSAGQLRCYAAPEVGISTVCASTQGSRVFLEEHFKDKVDLSTLATLWVRLVGEQWWIHGEALRHDVQLDEFTPGADALRRVWRSMHEKLSS